MEDLSVEKMSELSSWKYLYDTLRQYVSYERFVSHAKTKGVSDDAAEELYSIFSSGFFRNLDFVGQDNRYGRYSAKFPEAINIAKELYENTQNCVKLHRRSSYESPDIRRYYFGMKDMCLNGVIVEFEVNLSESLGIIELADILKNRTDLEYVGYSKFAEEVQFDNSDRKKIEIFEGDIIFVHHDVHDHMFSLYKVQENAGVYICESKGCYVKLRYMQGTGYVDKDGELNKSDKRFNHYGITGIADAQYFDVVGNIYKDMSVLYDSDND